MRITRFPSLSENQFLGCNAAFVDVLTGELHAATIALRRLEGHNKGSAFAHEMTLDQHRYGALIVLDRWGTVVRAFGPHVELARWGGIVEGSAERVEAAEKVLSRANDVLDSVDAYKPDMVEGVAAALQSVGAIFRIEREAAEQMAGLGPMLPEDYREARRILLEDLAAR